MLRYRSLAEALYQFLLSVRDAHGVVSRPLLAAFASTLTSDVKLNFMTIGEQRRDLFFQQWRRFYC